MNLTSYYQFYLREADRSSKVIIEGLGYPGNGRYISPDGTFEVMYCREYSQVENKETWGFVFNIFYLSKYYNMRVRYFSDTNYIQVRPEGVEYKAKNK